MSHRDSVDPVAIAVAGDRTLARLREKLVSMMPIA